MRIPYGDNWADEPIRQNDDPEEFTVSMGSESGEYTGIALGEFENFLYNLEYIEGNFSDFEENLYEEMLAKDLIRRDVRSEKYWPDPIDKEKQIELPLQEGRGIKIKIKRCK